MYYVSFYCYIHKKFDIFLIQIQLISISIIVTNSEVRLLSFLLPSINKLKKKSVTPVANKYCSNILIKINSKRCLSYIIISLPGRRFHIERITVTGQLRQLRSLHVSLVLDGVQRFVSGAPATRRLRTGGAAPVGRYVRYGGGRTELQQFRRLANLHLEQRQDVLDRGDVDEMRTCAGSIARPM